jgi:hypothetical protein
MRVAAILSRRELLRRTVARIDLAAKAKPTHRLPDSRALCRTACAANTRQRTSSTLQSIPVQGYKVVEIGNDHIVVQDVTGVTEFHIPMYSSQAIVRVNVPKL